MKAPVNPSQPPVRADYSTIEQVSQRLLEASEELSGMTEGIATARQIREFASDRRKRALAIPMREFLVAKESAASAETKARASAIYGESLDQQEAQLREAELVIAGYEACRVRWESARSCLSALRNIAGNV